MIYTIILLKRRMGVFSDLSLIVEEEHRVLKISSSKTYEEEKIL